MLLDLLIVLVVVATAALAAGAVSRRRQRSLERWRVAIRALQSGTAVEVVCDGGRPQRVALLDPADEEFSMKLEEARAQALERVVALNTVHRSLTP